MTRPRIDPFSPGYDEHCVNVAQMIARAYDDVARNVHYKVYDSVREQLRGDHWSWEVLEQAALTRSGGLQRVELDLARKTAEESVALYIEITGANGQDNDG